MTILALAEGSLSESDFAAWLRARLRTRDRNDLHEPGAARPAKRGRPLAKAAPER